MIIVFAASIVVFMYLMLRVGILLGSGMEQARVIDYINQHPGTEVFRLADHLYPDQQQVYNQPWGTNDLQTPCTYPTCECPHQILSRNEKV